MPNNMGHVIQGQVSTTVIALDPRALQFENAHTLFLITYKRKYQ